MEIFEHPDFVKDEEYNKQIQLGNPIVSLGFNQKLLFSEDSNYIPNQFKKQEVNVNDLFQMNSTPLFEPTVQPLQDIKLDNNEENQRSPTKEIKAKFYGVPIKKSLSTPLPNYLPGFLANYLKVFWKSKKKRFEKIKINFGPNTKQDPIYNHKDNSSVL